MVPGLVPLGSALVQVTKRVLFTGSQLGSWLGSTWFLLGSSLCEPQKSRFRLGGVEKMLGSGLGSLGSALVQITNPGLVPLGSSLVPVCVSHTSRGFA